MHSKPSGIQAYLTTEPPGVNPGIGGDVTEDGSRIRARDA
jgi:hypothetical protein